MKQCTKAAADGVEPSLLEEGVRHWGSQRPAYGLAVKKQHRMKKINSDAGAGFEPAAFGL